MTPFFSADNFRQAIVNLLPNGPAWSKSSGSLADMLAAVWGETFARSSARATNLLADVFPDSSVELLPEWEASLDLPDPCSGENPTIAQRQRQVVARLTDGGGSSIAYNTAFARTLGYDISVTEFRHSTFGRKFGGCFGGQDWSHTWQVSIPQFTVFQKKFGEPFGEPFATWGAAVVQCELLGRSPAHTILRFAYGGGGNGDILVSFILDVNTLS